MSSGVESGGFSLIGLDGKPTDRAVALGQVARSIEENKMARKRSDGNVLTFSSRIPAKQVQVWDIRAYQ